MVASVEAGLPLSGDAAELATFCRRVAHRTTPAPRVTCVRVTQPVNAAF
jgi:hypothetical protein